MEDSAYDGYREIYGESFTFGQVVYDAKHLLNAIDHFKDMEENPRSISMAKMNYDMINASSLKPKDILANLRKYEEEITKVPYVADLRQDFEEAWSVLERLAKSRDLVKT
ncbi:hypothetical protein CL617_03505 [archaeon]|nr:hypothetical protein [archaeon]|tara:strand:+ start:1717 stop:2046 length:330 start_codon:yes stop_codon:yes gene_type:complete